MQTACIKKYYFIEFLFKQSWNPCYRRSNPMIKWSGNGLKWKLRYLTFPSLKSFLVVVCRNGNFRMGDHLQLFVKLDYFLKRSLPKDFFVLYPNCMKFGLVRQGMKFFLCQWYNAVVKNWQIWRTRKKI